ncbi:endogenous retrovirus group K member 6 Gag polyprotein-like [Dasypus novemcinctus]|uniref:endogenous retrovirus group K member 6 Gag polyprotein-like n=1 Tax=Dasypus novemcinctus TaxID=9361 RepID=UPI00265D9966|nr:uncharacterized protein LOC101433994 [Dasypus novemcinctus]
MGTSLSSHHTPQVRLLAALLDTNGVRVSLKQLQKYWDLLLPFNPWLATCQLWSPDTYSRLIDRVTSAIEHERRSFPPGLLPTLVAVRACLLGAPSEVIRDKSIKQPNDYEPDDLRDTNSLSDQLAAALEREPPRSRSPPPTETVSVAPQNGGPPPPSSTPAQDGVLPASSSPGSEPAGGNKGASSRLYPPLPVSSSPGPAPGNNVASPPSWPAPGNDVASPPSWPAPGNDVASPPSWPAPGNDVASPPSWPAPGNDVASPPSWPAPGNDVASPPSWPAPGNDVASPPSWPAPGNDVASPPSWPAPGNDVASPPSWPAPGNDVTPPPSWPAPGNDVTSPPSWPAPGNDVASPPSCPTLKRVPPPACCRLDAAKLPLPHLFPATAHPSPPPYNGDSGRVHPSAPQLYPLNPLPTPQRPQTWLPFTAKEIKTLRKAVKEDGIGSPYVQQLLEELGVQLALPYDWISLARAILQPGQFLEWRAYYQHAVEQQVAENARIGVRDPPDAYTRINCFANPQSYVNIDPGFWQRAKNLVQRSFSLVSSKQSTKFAQMLQDPQETFPAFVARVLEACQRKITNEDAQFMLAKELILDGCLAPFRTVILPLRDKQLHEWVLACRDVDPQTKALTTAFASAMAVSSASASACFRCGQPGHFIRECPQQAAPRPAEALRRPRGPPTPCPRCGKGYHWARDCRSSQQPLNFQRGRPQPLSQEAFKRAPKP